MIRSYFLQKGWCRFEYDPVLANWINQSLPAAIEAVHAPENAQSLRCGGTWYAGVNLLPNSESGAVRNGPDLAGTAINFINESLGLSNFAWDKAQISVIYPGYPRPMPSEPPAAFKYRRERDAAHVDGLLPEGPDRRRHLREHHGFILGIPMVEASTDASPFVVWEGSHEIMRQTFRDCFSGRPPQSWGEMDITRAYHQARRQIFESCERVCIPAKPGEAILTHRLVQHGVAPWADSACAGTEGRMICYFRPETGGPEQWLNAI